LDAKQAMKLVKETKASWKIAWQHAVFQIISKLKKELKQ
jgi:hypothetical protein